MIEFSLDEIARITGGHLVGADATVSASVVTDSRECVPGSLYVARVGEHADGHDYAPAARDAGAVGVLGERAVDILPTVVVENSELAFAKLARGVVDAIADLEIVGITGSSGKTSTKDLLGAVLARFGPTVAPHGSLNSEVGVPLTVCRLGSNSRYLVAEMGASGVGHIEYLTKIAPPKVGIVLNVGKAHMGEFGSVDAIAQTKGELVEALPEDGFAVLNVDDERVRAMASRTKATVVLVGLGEDADYRATNVEVDTSGRASYDLTCPAGTARVRLAVFGEHQVGNSLSVIAAAVSLGLDLDTVVEALAAAGATSRWRMEVHELPGDITLVNDAYNANPDSMRAAMRSLAHMGRERHSIAVLGEMRELGETSFDEHAGVGREIAALGIDEVYVVGAGAAPIAVGAREAGMAAERVHEVENADAAHDALVRDLSAGRILLLKSSRDSGLRLLGDRLVEEAGTSAFPATEVTA